MFRSVQIATLILIFAMALASWTAVEADEGVASRCDARQRTSIAHKFRKDLKALEEYGNGTSSTMLMLNFVSFSAWSTHEPYGPTVQLGDLVRKDLAAGKACGLTFSVEERVLPELEKKARKNRLMTAVFWMESISNGNINPPPNTPCANVVHVVMGLLDESDRLKDGMGYLRKHAEEVAGNYCGPK